MRLVSYEIQTPVGLARRIGALREDDTEIVDLNLAYQWLAHEKGNPRPAEEADFYVPPNMLDLLRGEEQSMNAAREAYRAIEGTPEAPNGGEVVIPRTRVRMLSPVPRPNAIRDFSEFEEHGLNMRGGGPNFREWYSAPSHAYNGNPWSVGGPDDPIPYPNFTEQWDLEAELGFFIGKRGTNLTIEEGATFIAGYTLFIDCSARDVGTREVGGVFKHKDAYNVIGPCLVTPDEFEETHGRAWIKINGATVWEYEIGRRRKYLSPALVAFASDSEYVVPGDFFGTGTIGTGCALDLGTWVQIGDRFEFGLDGIGVLRHDITRTPVAQEWVRNGAKGNLPAPGSTDDKTGAYAYPSPRS